MPYIWCLLSSLLHLIFLAGYKGLRLINCIKCQILFQHFSHFVPLMAFLVKQCICTNKTFSNNQRIACFIKARKCFTEDKEMEFKM